ncbi:MAG: trehalose-phosphatase [Candidatus Melainabacteria bacterium RIFOXYA12_FULL_32_12]|nr:MAG: trehalose-phosphatase [Candidatus Melainabacteria bacterium RIFOXYA2_FULL_32_9]OGI30089.1 MAG: trehalose-phosphatase [Candidatus Melainabacteria bacterium RIFOXYA12_FULL_32_12]
MQALDKILYKIKENNKVLLIFDYDGTLVPIVEKPELARLDSETRQVLEELSNCNLVKIALISGRDIKTLQELSGIVNKNILIYGIHGGEILKNGKIHINVSDCYKKIIENLKNSISDLNELDGIYIEDKQYSISVHYRLANEQNTQIAINRFKEAIKSQEIKLESEQKINIKSQNQCYFRFQEGKKVLELLPNSFNKGSAVESLISDYPDYFPTYFGDDKTDVYAFEKVKSYNGLAFFIGNELVQPADQAISIIEIRDFLKKAKNLQSINH